MSTQPILVCNQCQEYQVLVAALEAQVRCVTDNETSAKIAVENPNKTWWDLGSQLEYYRGEYARANGRVAVLEGLLEEHGVDLPLEDGSQITKWDPILDRNNDSTLR